MKNIKYPNKSRLFLEGRLLNVLLLLLQLAVLIALLVYTSRFWWVSLPLVLLNILVALYLLAAPFHNSIKLSWMFFLLLFPLGGGPIYLILHLKPFSKRFRREMRNREDAQRAAYRTLAPSAQALPENEQHHSLITYLQNTPVLPAYQNTQSQYFGDGKSMLDAMLADMKRAEKFIFMEYYIIEEGLMWNSILEVLRERAAAGVEVRVIYDDSGSFLSVPVTYKKKLGAYGIKCEAYNRFSPLLTTLHNNRDHRKITSIDGKIAYTGGINLADEYINVKTLFGHWYDTAVRLQGAAAESLTVLFLQTWQALTHTNEPLQDWITERDISTPSDGWVQPYGDDPMGRDRVGERIYLHAITSAKKSLYITTPYLIIGNEIISALKASAQSGVDVRIVTPGIPDKKAVFFTTRSHYRELLLAGVKIYEYTPGFVHAKMIVCDDSFCMVGTSNMDYRSFYINRECGVCFYDSKILACVKNDLLQLQEKCRRVTEDDCKTNVFIKILQGAHRLFAPLF